MTVLSFCSAFLKSTLVLVAVSACAASTAARELSLHSAENLDSANAKHIVTYEDLQGIKGASGLTLSPDGAFLAYELSGGIWVLSTSKSEASRKISEGFSPIWSTDGSVLAFIANSQKDQSLQIHGYNIEANIVSQITDVSGGVAPGPIDWSSADELVFTVNVPLNGPRSNTSRPIPKNALPEEGMPLILTNESPDGYALDGIITGSQSPSYRRVESSAELFIHKVSTNKTTQLTHDAAGYSFPVWSPDGNYIASVSEEGRGVGAFENALYIINRKSGRKEEVVSAEDKTKKIFPSWSNNGTYLAYEYHSFSDGKVHGIGVATLNKSGKLKYVRNIISGLFGYGFVWSPDSKLIYASTIDSLNQPLFAINAETGQANIIAAQNAVSRSVTISQTGVLAWNESSGAQAGVIKMLRLDDDEAIPLLDLNPQIAKWAIGSQEIIQWKNSRGKERIGLLIYPAGYKPGVRYPMIVSCYTYPSHLNTFNASTLPGYGNQSFASQGYVVFFPNVSLPWHYGLSSDPVEMEEIAGASGWDTAVDNVLTGIDMLIDVGIVDANRIGAMGHSNGGAVVSALITRSDRFKAAVAVAPANLDWIHKAAFQDNEENRFIPTKTFTGVGVELWQNPKEYYNGSPLYSAHRVSTPTLLAVGDNDFGFTLDAIGMYLGIRRAGAPVTLLRYAEMGHIIYGPSGRDLYDRILSFFDEKLDPR